MLHVELGQKRVRSRCVATWQLIAFDQAACRKTEASMHGPFACNVAKWRHAEVLRERPTPIRMTLQSHL